MYNVIYMFLKIPKYKNGKTFLSILQGYRDENGIIKQKTIEKLVYLEELKNKFDVPIKFYKDLIEQKKSEELSELIIKNIRSKRWS